MKAYLGLGSNQGDRYEQLKQAAFYLNEYPQIRVVKTSEIYETEPWGGLQQDYFLNQVVEIETDFSPCKLLAACQEIEEVMGRKRLIHWGPRTIDIDILLFEGRVIEEQDLIIPHPYLEQREFVLIPLKEIAPDLVLPSGTRISDIEMGKGFLKRYD